MPLDFDINEIYARFLSVQMMYAERNDKLERQQQLFDSEMWEEEDPEGEMEEVQLTLNYVRRSVLWHVGLLTGKPPRVDVPLVPATPDPAAMKRERFLRLVLADRRFRRAWRRVEVHANKYGYGVMQVLWQPPKGQPATRDVPIAEGSTSETSREVHTAMPFLFRALDPRRFMPRYNTYDDPQDFLYVFRWDPGRLVEDLQMKYDADLGPTGEESGTIGTCDLVEYWDDDRYVLLAITSRFVERDNRVVEERTPVVLVDKPHAYGRPPFFVLPNVLATPEEDPTDGGSLSEVDLVEALNKHLNLLVSLTATEIATRIHPPAVYQTDNPQQDINNIRLGAGEVIPIGVDEELIPLSWSGIPAIVAEHRDAIMGALRDFSGLPKTSFGSSEGASGIGMRLAFAVLEMILPLKLPERCDVLTDLLGHVLKVVEVKLPKLGSIELITATEGRPVVSRLTAEDIDGSHLCIVSYGNLIPRDQQEHEQHVVYMHKTGTISHRTALEMLDAPQIPDPDAELDRIRMERKDKALHPEFAEILEEEKPGLPDPRQAAQGQPAMPVGPQPPPGMPLKMDSAPPVPQTPAMPSQQNAPFLQRGMSPGMPQMMPGPGGPGVNPGPPIRSQG